MSDADPIRAWLAARAPLWQASADGIKTLRLRRRASLHDAIWALDTYRSLASDLATARRELPGSSVTAALEAIYAAFHALIGRPPRNSRAALLRALRVEIPETFASLRRPLLWVALLFASSCAAGWWLIEAHPHLIGLIASEQMIDHVQSGHLWTDGLLNITPSSILSIKIFSNNIVVSAAAFCAGIFYEIGTFYFIALNGLMLGGAFAFTRRYGLDGDLLNFIVAHGLVELSIICIAGAAGATLGEALVRPDRGSRLESFQYHSARLGKLLLLCAPLLIGCGLIEGFVSPDPRYPFASRLVIGVCYWFVMLAALTGRLFGRDAAQIRRRRWNSA